MNKVMIRFEPLQETELHDYWKYAVESWMSDMVRAGLIDENITYEEADNEVHRFLPQEFNTPGHYFFNIIVDRENVGKIWMEVLVRRGKIEAYLWDIVIDEKHRGKGYGKDTMMLMEDFVKKKGAGKISLNVFAYNHVARKLYTGAGYVDSAITMIKTL